MNHCLLLAFNSPGGEIVHIRSHSKSIVTIREVAVKAGLGVSTVSYALRNHPKIAEATRVHIQAVARELGYRPNPRIASLMAHIRGAHARALGERIAFVWVHTTRGQIARDPFLQRVFIGARQRAEQSGLAIEEFWTDSPGMTDRRLQEVIRARGIVGVVLSPVTSNEITLTLDWDWSLFASAVIGNVTWTPELHHAGHHHYLAMRMVLHELEKIGCRRPVALIELESNLRAKKAWEAAFLTEHPNRTEAQSSLQIIGSGRHGLVASWIKKRRPDALIVSANELLEIPGVRKLCRSLGLPVITLYWSEKTPPQVGGIDQCYDRIAAHAIDLVVAQLNSNETGIPDLPRIMLFPGRWIAPDHLARAGHPVVSC